MQLVVSEVSKCHYNATGFRGVEFLKLWVSVRRTVVFVLFSEEFFLGELNLILMVFLCGLCWNRCVNVCCTMCLNWMVYLEGKVA